MGYGNLRRRISSVGVAIYLGLLGVLSVSAEDFPLPPAADVEAMFAKLYMATPKAVQDREATFRKAFESDAFQPWGFVQWTQSYAAMYESTGDKAYAKALSDLVKLAFEFRDDRKGRKDALTGRVLAAWGTNDPYFKARTVRLGSAALVLSPAAKLAQLVKADPSLRAYLDVDPDKLQASIQESISVFDNLFKGLEGDGSRSGLYVQPEEVKNVDCESLPDETVRQFNMALQKKCGLQRALAGTPEAYNIEFLMGQALLYLGRPDMVARARQIAAYFFQTSRFAIDPKTGAASFKYVEGGRSEDVSHLNVDVVFLLALHDLRGRAGNVGSPAVDRGMLTALARSVSESAAVRREDIQPEAATQTASYVLTPYIDGSWARGLDDPKKRADLLSPRFSRVRRSCAQFTELVFVDRKLGSICWSIMKEPGMANPLGLSHLAKGLRRAAGREEAWP